MSGLSKLRVEVIEARNLEAKDSNGLSDPYCYLWIAPNDSKSRLKTKIMFKTLDPVWNETFEFDVDVTDPVAELRVWMYDYDMLSADDFMGLCTFPIYTLVNKGMVDGWYTLLPREGKKDVVKGDIHLRMTLSDMFDPGLNSNGLQVAKERELRFADVVSADILAKLDSQERKRQEIMFEFINTEEQYVADVNVIIQSFLHPICERKLLAPSETSSLFSNLEAILPVNIALLNALQERQKKNPLIQCLADVFLAHVDSLQAYTIYCSNQPLTTEVTEEFRAKYPEFAAFLDESRPECRNLGLQAFLVKPLQRLCKYPLLLRELDRATPDDHPDKKNIELACVKIKEVVDAANERTRQVEDLRKIQQIQQTLGEELCHELLRHGRKIVFDAKASVLPKGRNTPQDCYFVLFSDMILIAKQKKDEIQILHQIHLNVVQLFNLPDSSDLTNVIELKVMQNSWKMIMSSSEEKDKWWNKMLGIQDFLLYQAVCTRGQKLMEKNQGLAARVAARKGDTLVDELMEEIHKLSGIAEVSQNTVAQYKDKVQQLEVEKELLEVQVRQVNTKPSTRMPAFTRSPRAMARANTVDHLGPEVVATGTSSSLGVPQPKGVSNTSSLPSLTTSSDSHESSRPALSRMTSLPAEPKDRNSRNKLTSSASSTNESPKKQRSFASREAKRKKKRENAGGTGEDEEQDSEVIRGKMTANLASVTPSDAEEPTQSVEDALVQQRNRLLDLNVRLTAQVTELQQKLDALEDGPSESAQLRSLRAEVERLRAQLAEKDKEQPSKPSAATSVVPIISTTAAPAAGAASPSASASASPSASASSSASPVRHASPTLAPPAADIKPATDTKSKPVADTKTTSTPAPAAAAATKTTAAPALLRTPSTPSAGTAGRLSANFLSTAEPARSPTRRSAYGPNDTPPPAVSVGSDSTTAKYTLAQLKNRSTLPNTIDSSRLEDYLIDSEFETVLGLPRDLFNKLPAWRKTKKKKDAGLF